MKTQRRVLCILMILSTLVPAAAWSAQRTIRFAGYTWMVRSGSGGPGPNQWSDSDANVFVDTSGALHLKITNQGAAWYCSEVMTTQALGFGTYQFQLAGPIDRLDKNVVLGLFDYPGPGVGPDGTNEIDIEFARWGNENWPNGNYTVYPAIAGKSPASETFLFALQGPDSTNRFIRTTNNIRFQSLDRHESNDAGLFKEWFYQPSSPLILIPQQPTPLHLNLWLNRGNAPSNGQEVEVAISRLSFTPLLYGDVNGDGAFDARDLNLLMQAYLGLTPVTHAMLQVADVRPKPGTDGRSFGDGGIGSDDLVWMLRRFIGWVTEP